MSKKFKIGDRVRLRSGSIGVVDAVDTGKNGNIYHLHMPKGIDFWLLEPNLVTKVEEDKIVITKDGMNTIATHYHDGEKVGVGVAKCNSKEDVYDFEYGATLAMDRLFNRSETTVKKPTYPSGDFVCVRDCTPWWELGRVYHFDNGHTYDSVGAYRDERDFLFSDQDYLSIGLVGFARLKR